MRICVIILLSLVILSLMPATSQAEEEDITYIMEVKTNPKKARAYIEGHYPRVEILETYDVLLQAVAVRGKEETLRKLQEESFVQASHESQSYQAIQHKPMKGMAEKEANVYLPEIFNQSPYKGKGVKIGIVDTGIDLEHEDLQKNFRGGADLVEYEDQPSETTEGFGKTIHGSHVAGIIGADGALTGVAPSSEIYAYRALGPNGFGTSVQVIAAMEKALEDGVDLINLSLGNTINIPDYPTSKAVNEARKHGAIVVVANGNDGPEDWTIGAPATASGALSVGAYQHPMVSSYLYHSNTREKIPLTILSDPAFWQEERSYQLTKEINGRGLLWIDETNEEHLEEVTEKRIRPNAVIIDQAIMEGQEETNFDLPVALIESGKVLGQEEGRFYRVKTEEVNETVAPFSSRGPVAMNWQIKPDVLGPGVQIMSTIPGGYDILNGTSMAAPHVTGALAVIKEARPTWTNEQIIGAVKTTARKVAGTQPTEQGNGLVQIEGAIDTNIIIRDPILSFGKYHRFVDRRTIPLEIENISDQEVSFQLDIPKKEAGITWRLPTSFSLQAMEKKTIQMELKVNSAQIEEGMYEGFLSLQTKDKEYQLPYMYIVKEAAHKKVEGFEIKLQPSARDLYAYEFYATEEAEKVDVFLLDREDFIFKEKLLTMEEVQIGKNEGEIPLENSDIMLTNRYVFVFLIQLQNGKQVVEYLDL